jgi:NADH-quinone oxidoreductase subunit H
VNRAPFDLPEAEQELTAGYLTEYSGLRWSLYQMAEYINMITVSAVASTLFLGGWSLFGLERLFPGFSIIIFLVKVAFFLFLFIWLRATLPRIRYDRLMRLGWQVLLPLAVLNVVITAICVALGIPWYVNGLLGLAIVVALLYFIRGRSIATGTRFTDSVSLARQQPVVSNEEKPAGAAALPSSVRLARFERIVPESVPTVEEKQEQDAKTVKA